MKHYISTLARQVLVFVLAPFYIVRTLIDMIATLHAAATLALDDWEIQQKGAFFRGSRKDLHSRP